MNAKSLEFLRPIFKCLNKTDDIVLIECLYSRQGGNRELVLIDNTSQLKDLIRRLPQQTIVRIVYLKRPNFSNAYKGIIPKNDGSLEYGAY